MGKCFINISSSVTVCVQTQGFIDSTKNLCPNGTLIWRKYKVNKHNGNYATTHIHNKSVSASGQKDGPTSTNRFVCFTA